jgi:hypothetical protein
LIDAATRKRERGPGRHALGDVPRQAEVGAGDLEELRALAGIAHLLGRAYAAQGIAVVFVTFVRGGNPVRI